MQARHTTTRARRSAAGLGALLFTIVAVAPSVAWTPPAQADTTTASGCVSAGKVWLVVSSNGGPNVQTCVGTPSTGLAALQASGLSIDTSPGYLARIGGFPAVDGWKDKHYWTYYHKAPGGSWQYSSLGANAYQPKPGTAEGWCYTSGTRACVPPALELTIAATTRAPKPTATASSTKPVATTSVSAAKRTSATPTATSTSSAAARRREAQRAAELERKRAADAKASAKASAQASGATPVPSASASASATASASASTTPSASTSATPTPSVSPSATPTPTPSVSPSATPTPSGSVAGTEATSAAPAAVTPSPASDASTSSGSSNGPAATVGTLAALGVGAGGYLVWRRKKRMG